MRFLILLVLGFSSLLADGIPVSQSKQNVQPFIDNFELEGIDWNKNPVLAHIRRRRAIPAVIPLLTPLFVKLASSLFSGQTEEPVSTSNHKQPVPTSGSNGVTNNKNGTTNNFG
uniref:Uncharacterized protein n=1 Tax=Caenorhabditis japonica TaxID=281687 RepID=A0A8R1E3B8_CAEJA